MQSNQINEYVRDRKELINTYLETLAQYGAQPEGGIVRPVYTPEWLAAFRQLESWFREAGLEPKADAMGNLWGRLEGLEKDKVITSGSHFDTVKKGGKYDGALGVIAALCAVRFLKELFGQPRRSLEVLALCEEEGSRFSNTFLGSRAVTGQFPVEEVLNSYDPQGVSLIEAGRVCGADPAQVASVARTDIEAFIELHIEQGPVLEKAGKQIGVVEAITGLQHLFITIEGRPDHAGTTPMKMRSDALVASASAIQLINKAALDMGHPAVATVGWINAEPGGRNIVPGKVEFTIDFRHPDKQKKAALRQKIIDILELSAAAYNTELHVQQLVDRDPADMTPAIVNTIRQAAEELGLSSQNMVSGAGHDSQVMVEKFPTGMIFVPSQGGRSHSAAEFTPIDQIADGIATLALSLYRLAY
jgi:allantoate deiminase